MKKFDDATKENIKEHNPNWSQVPDNLYRFRKKQIHFII